MKGLQTYLVQKFRTLVENLITELTVQSKLVSKSGSEFGCVAGKLTGAREDKHLAAIIKSSPPTTQTYRCSLSHKLSGPRDIGLYAFTLRVPSGKLWDYGAEVTRSCGEGVAWVGAWVLGRETALNEELVSAEDESNRKPTTTCDIVTQTYFLSMQAVVHVPQPSARHRRS
ncbi:hypothetical protein BDR03DRAFT_983906 [Suillus americanus]|nr:hypothetical protein BDR03DRAFT_983906 [Suillus americanus]